MSDLPSATTIPIPFRADNSLIFLNALMARWRSGTWLYDPDLALASDPSAWEKVRRDVRIAGPINKRLHMVATPEWNLEPGGETPEDEACASIIEEIVRDVPQFQGARLRLAQLVFLSRSYEFVEGERRKATFRGVRGNWWVPKRLRHVDRRRFRYKPVWSVDDRGKPVLVEVVEQVGDITSGMYVDNPHPELLVRGIYQDEEGRLGYGLGLLETLYYALHFRGILWREGLQGAERWAQGWVLGKIDESLKGADSRPNDQLVETMIEELEKMRSRGVLVLGKGDEVDVVESSGSGNRIVMDLIEYLDDACDKLILAATRTIGGGEGGSYALAQVEERSTRSIVEFDRSLVDEALTRGLVNLIFERNRMILFEAGLVRAKCPRFRSVAPEERGLEGDIAAADALFDAGQEIEIGEYFRRMGYSRPGPNDETVKREAKEPTGFAGFPSGGGFPFAISGRRG